MNDDVRLKFLAANYYNLRNLRLAPLYALIIAGPWLDRIDMFHMSDKIWLTYTGAGLGVCIAWSWGLGAYYKHRYGQVEMDPMASRDPKFWKKRANLGLLLSLANVICYLAILKTRHPRGFFDLVASLLYVALFAGLTTSNIALRRSYYIAANTSLLLIQLAVIIPSSPGHSFLSEYLVSFFGAFMLVVAVLDHFLLTWTFRHAPRDAYA
jgi:hypothetical protein